MTAHNETVEPYLEDLEDRLDGDVETDLLAEWRQFADGEFAGGIFSPRRKAAAAARVDWPAVGVNPALDSFDAMVLQQLKPCSDAVASASGALPAVRCNYGTGIMPDLFGAEPFTMADELDTLPTSRPLAGGADAIRVALDAGLPDVRAGLGGKVLDMARYFMAIKARYPNIGRFVHVYHPDLQGPMDICELLWGSEIFLALVDCPGLVHAMLDLITETYIAFMNAWHEVVRPPADGRTVHWAMMHRGTLMIRDDSAMNLSPAMVDEFCLPYDRKLLDAFGGGAVHFCGRGDHYIASYGEVPNLHAVHLTQPGHNNMETVFPNTVDKGIALLALARDTAEAALDAGRDLHGLVHCR